MRAVAVVMLFASWPHSDRRSWDLDPRLTQQAHIISGFLESTDVENCCHHVFVLCTSDIYYTSVHPRKKGPSSVVLPEFSYFPCLGFFKFLLHPVQGSKGRGCHNCSVCQSPVR